VLKYIGAISDGSQNMTCSLKKAPEIGGEF
jgi:hypothetical protein